MKKTTVWGIIAMIAAGVMSGACYTCGWYSHEDHIEKMKLI